MSCNIMQDVKAVDLHDHRYDISSLIYFIGLLSYYKHLENGVRLDAWGLSWCILPPIRYKYNCLAI